MLEDKSKEKRKKKRKKKRYQLLKVLLGENGYDADTHYDY